MLRAAVLLSVVVIASAASAEPAPASDAAKAVAREEFRKATKAYNLGEYESALQSFRAAYRAYEDASFLFNIAQCQRQLGQTADALRSYRAYLREAPGTPNRAQVQQLIAEMEQTLRREQESRMRPPQGTLRPDSNAVPEAPRSGEPESAAPATEAPPPPATTSEPAHAPANAVATSAPTPSERTPLYKKWWLWTAVGGVVVVGVAIGLGVGLSHKSGTVSYPTAGGLNAGTVTF